MRQGILGILIPKDSFILLLLSASCTLRFWKRLTSRLKRQPTLGDRNHTQKTWHWLLLPAWPNTCNELMAVSQCPDYLFQSNLLHRHTPSDANTSFLKFSLATLGQKARALSRITLLKCTLSKLSERMKEARNIKQFLLMCPPA